MKRQSAALFRRDSSPCSRAAGWGVLLRRGVKTPGAYCEPCSVPLRRGGAAETRSSAPMKIPPEPGRSELRAAAVFRAGRLIPSGPDVCSGFVRRVRRIRRRAPRAEPPPTAPSRMPARRKAQTAPRAKNLTGGLPRPTVLERIRPAAISTTSRMSNCSRFKAGLLFAIHRQAFN